jgi:YggT family protein
MGLLLNKINGFIATLIYFYSILIVLRIFLSWLPSINWESQPFKFMRMITDAYLDIFRRFVPPLGGLDFSPIVALLVLSLVQDVFIRIMALVS